MLLCAESYFKPYCLIYANSVQIRLIRNKSSSQ